MAWVMQKGQMSANEAPSPISGEISCRPVSTEGTRNALAHFLHATVFWPTELPKCSRIYAFDLKELIGVNDYKQMAMARPGVIAFPVILVLGGITGYLTYDWFTAATPDPGVVDSPYWKPLSASAENQTQTGGNETVDESQFTDVVTINILEGSAVQGSPDYDPDEATASAEALIKWVNADQTLHSATSGSGPSDAESGALFDSGFLNAGDEFSIPAADLGTGEHTYYCQIHPYMISKITVQ
jgi:plastocyanin